MGMSGAGAGARQADPPRAPILLSDMTSKPVLTLVFLLAIGVPAAFLACADWSSVFKPADAPTAAIAGYPPGAPGATGDLPGAPHSPVSSPMTAGRAASDKGEAAPLALEGGPGGPAFQDLPEILRFDVTPGWIISRWPWVSAGLAQLDLQGYRVPVVTGAGEDDLAGALTYYFNPRQQVQRITFRGTTGDPGPLIRLLASRFRFGRRLTNDPGLFRYEVAEPSGPAKSYLDIRLLRPTHPAHRFEVSLVVERPKDG